MIKNKDIVAGRNLIKTVDYKKHYMYKFNDMWLTAKELVALTNKLGLWTEVKDNRTKYNILANPNRWYEIPVDNLYIDVAAPIFDGPYKITTNGKVLGPQNNQLTTVNLIARIPNEDGIQIRYNVSDLLWHAFVCKDYPPHLEMVFFADTNMEFKRKRAENDIGLDEVSIKDAEIEEYYHAIGKELPVGVKLKKGNKKKEFITASAKKIKKAAEAKHKTMTAADSDLNSFLFELVEMESKGFSVDWNKIERYISGGNDNE